jgi:hypothetical protein
VHSRAGCMSSCEQEQKPSEQLFTSRFLKQTSLTMPPSEKIEVKLAFMSEDTAKGLAVFGLSDLPEEERRILGEESRRAECASRRSRTI